MIKMFKDKLLYIFSHLNAYEKNNVMNKCISDRLDKTLKRYQENLTYTTSFLLSKNTLRMLKILEKEDKNHKHL